MRHGRRDGRHRIAVGSWHRVVRDPQRVGSADPQSGDNIEQAGQEAGKIYSRYGGLTTAASIIATWAIIHTAHRH
jgi:hypothetical protein